MVGHLKQIDQIMKNNLEQAKRYALKAYETKDKSKLMSAWYKEMAIMHLNFNNSGATIFKKIQEEIMAKNPSQRTLGMMDVYLEKENEYLKEGIGIKTMIDCIDSGK